MAGQSDEYVFRHLPASYRRAGTEGPAYALTHMLGRSVGSLDRVSLQVMKSRFLEHLNDLDDAERLAALFELAPWPEEDLEAFRSRVRLMARIYLQGAATADRLLGVLGAAFDLELAGFTLPLAGGNDRFTTTGTFRERNEEAVSFSAAVVDLPIVVNEVQVTDPHFKWKIENNLYAEPPAVSPDGIYAEGKAPEPVIDIEAGVQPVVLPVIVQEESRRYVLINRIIPPGAKIRVDLRSREIADLTPIHTLLGPVEFGGYTPELLFGTGGSVDTDAGGLSGPTARPFHVLSWSDAIRQDDAMPEVPGPPGSLDPVPAGKLPWPPMVALGVTRWRLMRGAARTGGIPAFGGSLPSEDMRVLPLTDGSKPVGLDFRWLGRQLGTFTISYSESELTGGAFAAAESGTDDGSGAAPSPEQEQESKRRQAWLKRRQTWLCQQIQRLKLAGVQYVDLTGKPAEIALPVVDGDPMLVLSETLGAVESLDLAFEHDPPKASFADTLLAADQVVASVGKPKAIGEQLRLTDSVDAVVTPGAAGPVETTMSLAEQLRLTDSVETVVTPGAAGPGEEAMSLAEQLQLTDSVETVVTPHEQGPAEYALALSELLLPKETLAWKVLPGSSDRGGTQGLMLNERLVLKDRLQADIRSQ